MTSGIRLDNMDPKKIIELFSYNSDKKKQIAMKIKDIEDFEKSNKVSAYKKGRAFEELIYLLFDNKNLLEVTNNARTSDCEIDFVVSLTLEGKCFRALKIIPDWIPDWFIVECKNYKSSVGITHVAKFFGLVESRNAKLGVFISNKPITGRDQSYWADAASLVNKVNLSYLRVANGKCLLDICLEDIIENINGDSGVFSILECCHKSLVVDIRKEIKHEHIDLSSKDDFTTP